MLVSIAVIGRIYMNFIPNVQPMTSIIIITAILLGRYNGALVAVLSIILSNMYLGFGPWLLPQIISFGLIAIISGSFRRFQNKNYFIYILAFLGLFSGYLHGLIMSFFDYIVYGQFWAYYLTGIPFDTYHAVGNLVISLLIYQPIKKMFYLSFQK